MLAVELIPNPAILVCPLINEIEYMVTLGHTINLSSKYIKFKVEKREI